MALEFPTRSEAWHRRWRHRRHLLIPALLGIGLGLAACGTSPATGPASRNDELRAAPAWVLGGCAGPNTGPADSFVCGVGSMGGTRNLSLARTTAIARARTEIARSLDLRVRAMLQDYQAATAGGESVRRGAADSQGIVDVSRQITSITLAGSELRDTWISPKGTVFALVVLDRERFAGSVARMDSLSEQVRQIVRAGARPPPATAAPQGTAAHPLQLVTQAEAALPSDTRIGQRRDSETFGPRIEISSPRENRSYSGPFPIEVEFTVGESGEPVDMDTLKVEYKRAWGIDITSRVRDYVRGSAIRVAAAHLPPGRHSVEILISDFGRNRSARTFTVVVDE